MAIWRWLSVLLTLSSASAAATADDLAKLKASLAERFVAYRSFSVEISSSGQDPGNPTSTIGSEAVWERSAGNERFELILLPSNDSKSVTIFDGVHTTSVWYPGPNTKDDPGYKGLQVSGAAQIRSGGFSYDDYGSNAAVNVFGLTCSETGTDMLELVNSHQFQAISPVNVGERECLAWSVSGHLRGNGTFQATLAVDAKAGWLPVQWEATRNHSADGSVFRTGWEVTESTLVTDTSSGQEFSVPKRARYTENGKESADVAIHMNSLGVPVTSDRFQVSLPEGFRVADASVKSKPHKEYISGGPQAERAHLLSLAGQARVLNNGSQTMVFDASAPKGTLWSLWVLVIVFALIICSLYVRRL